MTLAAYARAVERLLARAALGPVVLSPRDWQRVESWYARAIPLVLIDEALAAWAERGRRAPSTASPVTLAAAAHAVEEAWAVIREGRLQPGAATAAPPTVAAARCWAARADKCRPGAPLALLLESLLARLAAGELARQLDEELDERLPAVADGADRLAIDEELDRELASLRSRMGAQHLEATRRRASIDRLRRRLGLPRLV